MTNDQRVDGGKSPGDSPDASGEPTPFELKTLSRAARIEAALRELIWRMDHVRTSIESAATVDRKQLLAMLDTTDALAALDANTESARVDP